MNPKTAEPECLGIVGRRCLTYLESEGCYLLVGRAQVIGRQRNVHPVFGIITRSVPFWGPGWGSGRSPSPGAPGESLPRAPHPDSQTRVGRDAPRRCTHPRAGAPAFSPSLLPHWPRALTGSRQDRQTDAENVILEREDRHEGLVGVERGPAEERLITALSAAVLGQSSPGALAEGSGGRA